MDMVGHLRGRWERLAPEPLRDYPWWLPIGTAVGVLAAAVAAVIQRRDVMSPALLALALALLLIDVIIAMTGRLTPWPLTVVCFVAATAILLTKPVSADVAPLLLVISAAKIMSTASARAGLLATACYLVVLVTATATVGLWGFGVYVVGVLLGFDVGFTMQWQLRALTSERARLAAERDHAAAGERQRIAREIHDLVAHSLSVTMLHVTGARHALSTDRDIDEAVEALREAERVGRQAMADVRRTVGMLSSETSGTAALPGVDDIDQLVHTVRAAGVEVTYEPIGERGAVPPALGLGLYRIVQESLSNVAKHAPSGPASVRLELLPHGAHLEVRNPIRVDAPCGSGAGLPGMAERARQLGGRLTAGPRGDEWRVDFVVPADGSAEHECPLGRTRAARPR